MLTGIGRAALIAATASITTLLAFAPPAFAGGFGGTTCPPGSTTCTVTVGTPGTTGTPTPSNSAGDSGGSGGSGSSGQGSGGASTPSPEPTMINGSCVYAADPGYQPTPDVAAQHQGQPGAWYLMTCPDGVKLGTVKPIATTTTTEVWLTTPPPAALMKPTPAVLAAQAQQLLKLPKPVIASNPRPGLPQLVTVPVWTWIAPDLFAATSATATVPGESVTATATPVSVTWDFGDGTTFTCPGPGTPFPTGGDPAAASPTCGHTYTRSSGADTYSVTATMTWDVTWAGAGQVGTFAGMTTTASEQVRVLQSQAVVTSG